MEFIFQVMIWRVGMKNRMIIVKYWLLVWEKRRRSYVKVDWSLDFEGYCCGYFEKRLMWFKWFGVVKLYNKLSIKDLWIIKDDYVGLKKDWKILNINK